jgi:hypothetical protein
VSPMTNKQDSEANGSSQQAAQEWARQAAQYLRARQLATQAQLGPLAANARVAAQQGMVGARAWSAPRLALMSLALQEQWAPKISAALADYASRIDPTPAEPTSRRRWPAVVGGVVLVAGGAAAAAVVVLNRRNSAAIETGEPDETAGAEDAPQDMAAADTVGADVNGQTQAPRP